MIDALIDDGDTIVLEPVSTVEDGQMVAAWYRKENEATLKKFYMEKGRIRLQPANSQMNPIYVDPKDVEIQGRVVGVIRRLT
jgi:repressor LexA